MVILESGDKHIFRKFAFGVVLFLLQFFSATVFQSVSGETEIDSFMEISKHKEMKKGDVIVAASDTVKDDLATRGSITVEGVVEGRVAAIGGSVTVNGVVEGEIAAIGGSVSVNGKAKDDVAAIGGSVFVKGEIGGDVAAIGGDVNMDSSGVIEGDVASIGGSINIEEGAKIHGERKEIDLGMINKFIPKVVGTIKFGAERPFLFRFLRFLMTLVWLLGILIFVLMVVIFLPGHVETIAEAVRKNIVKSAAVGLLAELCFCPLLVFLVITIIGIPLVPVAVILALIAGLFGIAGVSLLVGRRLKDSMGWKIQSSLVLVTLGILILDLFYIVAKTMGLAGGLLSAVAIVFKLISFIIYYCSFTVGFGATLMTKFGTRKNSNKQLNAVVQLKLESDK